MRIRRPILLATAAVLVTAGLSACSADAERTTVSAAGAPSASRQAVAGSQRVDTAVDGTVWVANEDGGSISVLDARTARVVTTLTGIGGPHNVQAGSDGGTVYAVSGTGSTVTAVDSGTYAVRASKSTGAEPAHVIEVGAKVYVTSAGRAAVEVHRKNGLSRITTISLGGMPHGLRASRDGALVAVANMGSRAIDLIDTRTDRRTASIPVGGPPVQVAVEATGGYVYASVSDPPSVVKIDTRTRKIVGRAAVPHPPVQLYLTGDGGTVVSADQGDEATPGRTVSIISTSGMTTQRSIPVGRGPHGVALDADSRTAWVTNMYDDTVSVIDLRQGKVLATVAVGDKPNGISLSPRTPPPAPSATIPLNLPSTNPDHGGGGHAGHG